MTPLANGVMPDLPAPFGAPLFFPLAEWLARLPGQPDSAALAALVAETNLRTESGQPLSLVPPPEDGEGYEARIWRCGQVETRPDNWHDFFNGLVWLQFPRTKRRLNQLQAQAIAADGVQAVRGPLRDAVTVFDENGALLQAPDALWDALRARDWQRLFVDLRPLWAQARLVLFGHALLEKLVSPRKPMVAHVFHAPTAMNSIADMDSWLADQMEASAWSTKPFTPLPVLGVPGWWPANEAPGFYDDAQVFRPLRAAPVP